jgi:hypothetical protein
LGYLCSGGDGFFGGGRLFGVLGILAFLAIFFGLVGVEVDAAEKVSSRLLLFLPLLPSFFQVQVSGLRLTKGGMCQIR